MPRQNRVTPYGAIIATPERGLFMGNRGILHNEREEIVTPYRSKAWIICRLQFKGRIQEMVFALWLIVKGFNRAAILSE